MIKRNKTVSVFKGMLAFSLIAMLTAGCNGSNKNNDSQQAEAAEQENNHAGKAEFPALVIIDSDGTETVIEKEDLENGTDNTSESTTTGSSENGSQSENGDNSSQTTNDEQPVDNADQSQQSDDSQEDVEAVGHF